jgi:polyhydroxybutyrate depolymerase
MVWRHPFSMEGHMERHLRRGSCAYLGSVAALAMSIVACGGDDPSTSPGDGGVLGSDTNVPASDDGGDAPSDTAKPPTDVTPTPTGNVPGKYVHRETVDGQTREFIVYVPEKAKGTTPVPVVFVVHGSNQGGEHFYVESHWKEKADEVGLIAVFPTALTYCYKEDENGDGDYDDPEEHSVGTKWAAGSLGDPTKLPLCTADELAALPPAAKAKADHPLADDVAYFRFMLDFLGKRYAHDAHRVYVTGFSNGAGMASRLGNELPDRFAVAAAHAGTMGVTPVPAARPITFVFSLGNVDDRFTEKGSPIPLTEGVSKDPRFDRIVTPYLTSAQLAPTYVYDQLKAGTRDLSRFVYSTSNIGATNTFTALIVQGCFHQYPNGTNHPLVLADFLWDIFEKRALP